MGVILPRPSARSTTACTSTARSSTTARSSETLIDIVRALALGHACVAWLEREHKALTTGEDSQLAVQVAQALDELARELGVGPDALGESKDPEGLR